MNEDFERHAHKGEEFWDLANKYAPEFDNEGQVIFYPGSKKEKQAILKDFHGAAEEEDDDGNPVIYTDHFKDDDGNFIHGDEWWQKNSHVEHALDEPCGICGHEYQEHGEPHPYRDDYNICATCERTGDDGCYGFGHAQVKQAQTSDNPFSGYGRPFTDDPLNPNMSPGYYHDNPATAVGPYAGPSSYSINTVAPYAPPHGGEENPAQNVGPYMPPGTYQDGFEEPVDFNANENAAVPMESDDVRTAYKQWEDENEWFDGTSTSIYNRIVQAQNLRLVASKEGATDIEDILEEQIEVLGKVAAEYDDSNLHEFVEELPGGTVALEYDDLTDGGLVDITSFLHTEAYKIQREASSYDWERFEVDGAEQWILARLDENPGLLKHETLTREAAVDYVKDKTMILMDPIKRAEIIDTFVGNVEKFRREAANRLLDDHKRLSEKRHRLETMRMAQVISEVGETLDEGFYPGAYTELTSDYDEQGNLNIGEDDGSSWYSEAQDVLDNQNRDWANFTTEGAREWFFDKVSDSSSMFKHEDITRRAATEYAKEQTATLRDETLKSEIVRAFTASVDYLRDAYEHQETARLASQEEDSTFIDIMDKEEEILW